MQSADGAPLVLYVAWGFPPCRGGGVYRALATANGFAQQGVRVTVLTADREAFVRFTGGDVSLELPGRAGLPAAERLRIRFIGPATP